MARRVNIKDLLFKINEKGLRLYKFVNPPNSIWIFEYKGYRHVVRVVSLTDLSRDRWIYEGKAFVASVKGRERI